MPKRRYTAEELAFHGTAKRNPARYQSRSQSAGLPQIGYCPKHMTSGQRAIWRELVKLAPEGLLTAADTFAVELAVRLLERSRGETLMRASEVAILVGLLARLGLTPADRARLDLSAPATAEAGEFDEF